MKLIVASDPRGGIGYKNSLPWKSLSSDLARFKRLTTGKAVAMGKNTWDSLPRKPLPNRQNIIITSKHIPTTGITTVSNINDLLKVKDLWIIGGAKLIESCWDHIIEIHLSRTLAEYTCDTFIDLVKLNNYTLTSHELFIDHTYEIWKK